MLAALKYCCCCCCKIVVYLYGQLSCQMGILWIFKSVFLLCWNAFFFVFSFIFPQHYFCENMFIIMLLCICGISTLFMSCVYIFCTAVVEKSLDRVVFCFSFCFWFHNLSWKKKSFLMLTICLIKIFQYLKLICNCKQNNNKNK